jgi:autotransporter-associated beta strand protein
MSIDFGHERDKEQREPRSMTLVIALLSAGLLVPVVQVGDRKQELGAFTRAFFDGLAERQVHVVAETINGEPIETFDAALDRGVEQDVYNVAGAAPLVRWSAVYGKAAAPSPHRELGAPRWTTTDASILSVPSIGQYAAGTKGYLNFHGGTLQATGSHTNFLAAYGNAIDAVTIYGEGAKIDTNSHDITITDALVKATGQGLATIPVTDGGSGYIGAPVVKVTGGSGVGATAYAVMNGDKIDHIVISNPGTGYLATDVLTVSLVGGDYLGDIDTGGTTPARTTPATLGTLTFVDNTLSNGGLTKLGAGELTLAGPLSYTGDTTVAEGTLTSNGTIDTPNATITVAAGATLNAPTVIADTLNLGGGFAAASAASAPAAIAPVPEPSSIVLLALAGLALAGAFLRRK